MVSGGLACACSVVTRAVHDSPCSARREAAGLHGLRVLPPCSYLGATADPGAAC